MPDYKANDPKGWGGDPKRGAALGRPTLKGDSNYNGKLHLSRVYLNSGGYDKNGTYFGIGAPLYWYASEDGSIDGMLRSANRYSAKMAVKDKYSKAKFYR